MISRAPIRRYSDLGFIAIRRLKSLLATSDHMKKLSGKKIKTLKTCAAVGGAVAALPLAANATVVTVPVNATITSGTYDLTISPTLGGPAINTNGGPDLTFTLSPGSGIDANYVAGDHGTMYVTDGVGYPANVQGSQVGPSDSFTAASAKLSDNFIDGNFDKNGAVGYLGFEVPVSATSYDYGWVELSSFTPFSPSGPAPQSLTIIEYAYDDSGNPINVPAATPEPCTLALFALGAVGVEAFRRRTKALK